MRQIADSVVALTGISLEQMRRKHGTDAVVEARMLLVSRMINAGFSFAVIDKFLGRCHPGSRYIYNKYCEMVAVDRGFASRYPNQGARVYVAGAITGQPASEVKTKFEAAARLLAAEGYAAVLPTQIVPDGTAWREAMRICIGELTRCRYIFPLPCASESKGATIELQVAKIVGIPILNIARGTLEPWLTEEEAA
jgi:hypothetical protein